MREKIDTSDKQVKEATVAHEKAGKEMAKASQGLEPKYEKDLKAYLTKQTKKVDIQMGRMGSRIARVKMVAHRFGNQASVKETEVLMTLRSKALQVMQYNQAVKELSDEAFFGSADMEVKDIKKKSEVKKTEEKEEEAAEKA